jgi:hypothetical protein
VNSVLELPPRPARRISAPGSADAQQRTIAAMINETARDVIDEYTREALATRPAWSCLTLRRRGHSVSWMPCRS